MADDSQSWYVRSKGRVRGPFTWPQLVGLRDRRQLAQFDEVSQDRKTWAPAGRLTALFGEAAGLGAVAGSDSAMKAAATGTAAAEWYCNTPAGRVGPVTIEHVVSLLHSGQLSGQSLVWRKGYPAWIALRDVADLACHVPLAQSGAAAGSTGLVGAFDGGNTRAKRRGRSAAALGVIAASVAPLLLAFLAVLLVVNRKPQNDPQRGSAGRTSATASPEASIDARTFNNIGQAIGLVVSGFIVTDSKTGITHERPCRRATCFAVSPAGHLLTTKFLIDEYVSLAKNAAGLEEAQTKGFEIKPFLRAYLAGEKHDAQVVFVSSKHDLAVLKVERPGPHFRLAADVASAKGARIHVFGYLKAPSRPLTLEVATEQPPNDADAAVALDTNCSYGWCNGILTGVRTQSGIEYIEHNAAIESIGSGGPVVLDEGSVVGMITRNPSEKEETDDDEAGMSEALSSNQVRDELARIAPELQTTPARPRGG